jgi:hypothetical protein
LQNIGMALVMPADERASVGARVQENPQLAVATTDEEKWSPRHIAAPVVARVLHFRFVTQVEPTFIEYPLLFHPKNVGRRHSGAMDAEHAIFRVVYD